MSNVHSTGSGHRAPREAAAGERPVGGRDRSDGQARRSSRTRRLGAAGALALGTLLSSLFSLVAAAPVSADPSGQLQQDQAKAAQLSAQLQADSNRLDVLDQQYQDAQAQVQSLDQSLLETAAKVVATQATVNGAQARLRQQALEVYTGGGSDRALAQLFAPGGERSMLVREYQNVASARVNDTIDQLRVAEQALTQQQHQLQATETQARASASQLASAQSQAQAIAASDQSALSQVNGQIAMFVAQRQAAEQAAQAAAFQARFGASGALSNVPVAPGAAGAVQAAESQLGVPYRWGGEQPGVGFDCSGLTQWSWGRAGVSIPRTAQAQYDAIAHVPLSAMQPGDLVFWNDGTSSIQHVAMYVGNNTVIQAPHSGATVSYSPIWNNGLVGAGRP